MNQQIIENLYELWAYIGEVNNLLKVTDNYKAVSVSSSDWPNRVFNISDGHNVLKDIVKKSQQKLLPDKITVSKPNSVAEIPNIQLFLEQKNMSIDLVTIKTDPGSSSKIQPVRSKHDAELFADTASISFGYRVDPKIVFSISGDPSKVRLINYVRDKNNLCCGLVFFDSNENAGLHMIGTKPEGRGHGIGKQMTQKLLQEAKQNNCKSCVLHASQMGEPMYKKLGFVAFGELQTYRVT